ncbi:hypothetical protein ACGFNP_11245 [Nonomuraea sp. NPDC049269]|uniref:hypothetical protein n=1 Tax=Nonomuraea sp. NPDC049269 TaxID=3364349 RepID=UPI0037180E21
MLELTTNYDWTPSVARRLRVIDEFYVDAASVREFGLRCQFERHLSGSGVASNSLQRHPDAKTTYFRLAHIISSQKQPDWDSVESSFRFWGIPSSGAYALSLEGDRDTVHFHRRTGRWAGVCYLSTPEICNGRKGVIFYRHRETQLESFVGADSNTISMLRSQGADPSKWEEIGYVPMQFNRVALFDARHFHAASPGFGTSTASGRLTQLFGIDFLEDLSERPS